MTALTTSHASTGNLFPGGRWLVAFVLGTAYLVLGLPSVEAHPVPRRSYDRTVQVELTTDALVVHYRLELDEWTAIYVDLQAVVKEAEFKKLSTPRECYAALTRSYAPILARNLVATLDDKPVTLDCVEHKHQVVDSLRCEFLFKAPWKLEPGQQHEFRIRDGNYVEETGVLDLSLRNASNIRVVARVEPDEALRSRQYVDLKPGDETRRRHVSASFSLARPPAPTQAVPATPTIEAPPPADPPKRRSSLLALLDDDRALWILLCVAAGIGAIHALTPGHGKTVVAAYLVGERGTVWHALMLGVITTLTHTGVVLALAIALCLIWPRGSMSESTQQQLQTALEMAGGLLIAGLGVWLLLRRLAGRADHFHLGGHGHHHHSHGPDGHTHDHGHADHHHDEHGHSHPVPVNSSSVGWWGLVVLGISGGIVPCWDAIAMLVLAVSLNLLWLAVPLLIAFSAGLAAVLVVIGVVVVQVKRPLGSHPGADRLLRGLPLASALVITGMGLWLCYDSLHSQPEVPARAALSAPAE
jgi:ABC-type nickel/cobalt efflux system permease component RcnA